MQTFLPHANFVKSATCLDRQRLGKQRVECVQILRALTSGGGWHNHPAVKMWCGHAAALAEYGLAVCREWTRRGYVDNCADQIVSIVDLENAEPIMPSWLGNKAFHASHRSNLLRKDPGHYGQFGWTEPSDLPYIWPSPMEKKQMKFNNMSLEDLQVAHSEMCATAGDLGVVVPTTLSAEFDSQEKGVEVCEGLDDLINKFRAGIDDGKGLAKEEGKEQGAPAKKAASKKSATTKKEVAKPEGEETVAKKAVAKKKVAKKAVAKPAAKKAGSVARSKFPEDAKVTWIAKENPAREGSGRFERYEKLRKASGKTVKAVIAAGVPTATLANAVASKTIKIG